jgi:hypothetical protein
MEITLHSDLLSSRKQESAGETLLRSAAYTLLESPLKAGKQLVGADTSTPTLVAPPAEQEFGSLGWHAQLVGNTAGMLPWVVGLHKVIGRNASKTALGFSTEVKHSFMTGAVYGGLLTPSRDDGNLLLDRVRNATTSGVTFAALTGGARALRDAGMTNRIAIGVTSGLGAGLVHAETNALLNHGRLATGNDIAKDMYTFGLLGGTFGTAAEIAARRSGSGAGPGGLETRTTPPLAERVGSFLDGVADRIAPRPRLAFAFAEVEPRPAEPPARPTSDAPPRPVFPTVLNMTATEGTGNGGKTEGEPIIGSDSGRNLGTRVQRPDGTVIRNYNNGTRVTDFPEGDPHGRVCEQVLSDRTVTTYRNGERITEQANRRLTEKPDHSTVESTFGPDNTVRTVESRADGTRIETVEKADGHITRTTTRTTFAGETRIVEHQTPEIRMEEAVPDHWRNTRDNLTTVRIFPGRYYRTEVGPDGVPHSTQSSGQVLKPVARPTRK